MNLMLDLQVLAFKGEITRIATLMLARENSNAVYPGSGVREGFHNASHHSNERKNMDQFAVINRYHVRMLGYFLERLQATPDGDGTLLDNLVLLYGGGISNSDRHTHGPLPTLLLGGGAGTLKGGRHLAYPTKQVPTGNLLLSILDKYDIHQDSLGDSTGRLEAL